MAIKFAASHLMIEKQQFFELMNLLNKSNKTINETTEFIFFIEQDKLYFGQSSGQKFLISVYQKSKNWISAEYSHFTELEEFISVVLNENASNNVDINKILKESLFQMSNK